MNKYVEKLKVLLQTGFFHIFGSSVINKIVAFLSSAVMVRILNKSEYGVFTYAWNIYTIVLLANGMGMASSILQICSERSSDESSTRRIYNYGARFGIKFDVILSVVLVGIGVFMPVKINGANTLLCMLCFLPMVQLLYDLNGAYLRAQKRNQEYSRLTVTNTVLLLAASASGAFLFREQGMVVGYYAAYGASALLARFSMGVKAISREELPEKSDRIALCSIGFVSMCNVGLSQLMYHLDVLVLGIVAAEETVLASYKVATLIPSGLTFIPSALMTYLYPYFAEHRLDGAWCLKKYKQVVISLGALNLAISGTLFISAPLTVRFLFGGQYLDAVPVFRILSLNYFVSGTFRTLSGNLLVTQRKLKFNLLVAIVSSLTNIVADYFFIQWWGSTGAALATVLVVFVSSVLSTTYLIYTFRRKRGRQIK